MEKSTFCCIFCWIMIPASFVVLMCVFLICLGERVHITDASLTRFELETSPFSTLHYNLSVTMTIQNPNWYNKINYNHLVVDFQYDYYRFDWVLLPELYLHAKKTKQYNLTLVGNSTNLLGSFRANSFQKSNETGYFDFELTLKGFQKCKTDANHNNFWYLCPIRVHRSAEKDKFEVVKCHASYSPSSSSDY